MFEIVNNNVIISLKSFYIFLRFFQLIMNADLEEYFNLCRQYHDSQPENKIIARCLIAAIFNQLLCK